MRATEARRSNAVRAQWCRGAPTAVARWTGGPDPAAPGVKDATPGHPGELVACSCVVYHVRTVSSRVVDIYRVHYARYRTQIRTITVTQDSRAGYRSWAEQNATSGDGFAKVLDAFATDSVKFAQVRASSRRIRGFATHSRIRASSRKFATGSRGFATDSRRIRAKFARIRDGFTQVRDGFATGSHKFAQVCAGYNTVP